MLKGPQVVSVDSSGKSADFRLPLNADNLIQSGLDTCRLLGLERFPSSRTLVGHGWVDAIGRKLVKCLPSATS